jgi:hypothetical protein
MKKWLSLLTAAGLLLYPFAAIALDYGSQPSQTQEVPPVAQTLVREGDFAIRLAAELDLGNPTDEATAEDALATAGVVPANGWISDYPMTPDIVGQLQESIVKAAAEGNLPMNAQEATRGLYSLTAELNLPSPAGPEYAPAEEQNAPAEKSNPTVINNYYYNQGPPVVTYYPPPADYVYLYDWVPYPTWWFGFWFPGFFISHSFTTTVFVSGAVVVNRPFIGTRIAIVSNRIVDPGTRVTAVVSPVVRTTRGGVRPIATTTLRTESGRTFGTLAELRREAGSAGRQAVTPGTATNSTFRREGFRSPEARRSAESIFSRSVEGTRDNRGREGAARSIERRSVAPSTSGRSFNGPARGDNRRFVSPDQSGRSFSGQRRDDDRPFIAPRMSERRSFGSSEMRGSGQSVRPFAPQRAPAGSFINPRSGGDGNSTNSFSSGQGRRGKGGSGRGFSGGDCNRGRC